MIDTWAAGTPICRAHSHLFGSRQFDNRPDADSRFSTIRLGRSVIPVIYGGQDDHAAASETIFHTIDTPDDSARPRRVFVDKYLSWHWSRVRANRDLALVRLDGAGLAALQVTRGDLIESGRDHYGQTRKWAQEIAESLPNVDGLWWKSRQDPDRWAVVLFGSVRRRSGGISTSALNPDGSVVPFASSLGLDRLDQIATDWDITVVRP